MKVLVGVKRVIDYNVRIRVRPDGSGVEADGVKMSINPFDEIALEQAVLLKEAGVVAEILAVSIGPAACRDNLRTALAVGADRALIVETEADVQPMAAARIFRALVEREKPDLILLGKQAIDDDSAQTGPMLAGMLDWPQATFVSRLDLKDGRAEAVREVDGGLESLSLALPCVATTDLRLNVPRFATLPNIMRARKMAIEETTPEVLGVDVAPMLEILAVTEPPVRKGGRMVAGIAELVDALKNDAKVIP